MAIGVGQTAFTAAGPRSSTTFVTGIVDLSARPAWLLDAVPERTGKAVSDRASRRDRSWREGVTVAFSPSPLPSPKERKQKGAEAAADCARYSLRPSVRSKDYARPPDCS